MEIRSVTKAMRLLEELAKEPGLFGVSDLSRSADMDKSSVSRMLKTMEQAGMVAQDPTSQRYTLGMALPLLGYKALKRINIRDLAHEPLKCLAAATGECAHLAILVKDRAFYLEQVGPDRGVSVDAPVGTLAPLYCTALGKVLVAYQSETKREQLMADMVFEPFTRRTILDVRAYRAHVDAVRENGIAYDDEEFSVGVRCIAAPVFRHDGLISGAIGISGPSPRLTDDRFGAWGDLIRREAGHLSSKLGFQVEFRAESSPAA